MRESDVRQSTEVVNISGMPLDLSHLTTDELSIIKDVLEKQRTLEKQELQLIRYDKHFQHSTFNFA